MARISRTISAAAGLRVAGVIALAVLLATFIRGAGGERHRRRIEPPAAGNVLSWQAPLQFSNGVTLDAASDLAAFEIFISETGAFQPDDRPCATAPVKDPVTLRPVNSIDLSTVNPPLQAGKTYFLTMRAVGRDGARSPFSLPLLRFTYRSESHRNPR